MRLFSNRKMYILGQIWNIYIMRKEEFLIVFILGSFSVQHGLAKNTERLVENSYSLEAVDPIALWPTTYNTYNDVSNTKSYFAVLYGGTIMLNTGPLSSLGAMEFPGQSSYAVIHNDGDFDGTAAFTYMFYVYPYDSDQSVLLHYQGVSDHSGIQILHWNQKIIVRIFSPTGSFTDYVSSEVQTKLNEWSMVGVTYNRLWPNENLDIIDGSKKKDKFVVTQFDVITTGDIRFGSAWDNSLPFNGRISCIQFYNGSIAGGEAMSTTNTMCDPSIWDSQDFVEPTIDVVLYDLLIKSETTEATTMSTHILSTTTTTTNKDDFSESTLVGIGLSTATVNQRSQGLLAVSRPTDECLQFTSLENNVGITNSFNTLTSSSLSNCAQLCVLHTDCRAFTIDVSETICELSGITNVTSRNGFKTYVR